MEVWEGVPSAASREPPFSRKHTGCQKWGLMGESSVLLFSVLTNNKGHNQAPAGEVKGI